MKADVLESAAVTAPNAGSAKRLSGLMSRRPLLAASGAGLALYLEAFGLGFLITAVSGVLPLVMLLHR
jgi:hypothetical protein